MRLRPTPHIFNDSINGRYVFPALRETIFKANIQCFLVHIRAWKQRTIIPHILGNALRSSVQIRAFVFDLWDRNCAPSKLGLLILLWTIWRGIFLFPTTLYIYIYCFPSWHCLLIYMNRWRNWARHATTKRHTPHHPEHGPSVSRQ